MNPPKTTSGIQSPPKKRTTGKAVQLPAIQSVEAALQAEGPERERLLDLAEQEQSAGVEISRRADKTARRGQVLGLTSILLVLALAGYLGSLGEAAWATVIAGIDVVGVAGVFVTGQVIQRGSHGGA